MTGWDGVVDLGASGVGVSKAEAIPVVTSFAGMGAGRLVAGAWGFAGVTMFAAWALGATAEFSSGKGRSAAGTAGVAVTEPAMEDCAAWGAVATSGAKGTIGSGTTTAVRTGCGAASVWVSVSI